MIFKKLDNYELEFAQIGEGQGAVTVFRDPQMTAQTPWQKTHSGNVLIIGGIQTIFQLRKMWSEESRPKIQKMTGMAASTHAKVRDWLDNPTTPAIKHRSRAAEEPQPG